MGYDVFMRFRHAVVIAAVLSALACFAPQPACGKDARIPVKVAVVTMFELGNDTGDRPGELQYWVERKKLE